MPSSTQHRLYAMAFSRVYPLYVDKAQKKGRTQEEVDTIICWLTGYTPAQLQEQLDQGVNIQEFYERAPEMNPQRLLITGIVCGVRIEEVEETLMREIRYLDKLIDELAKGKPMEKILRKPT